jgi:hypothetical protein
MKREVSRQKIGKGLKIWLRTEEQKGKRQIPKRLVREIYYQSDQKYSQA